MIVPGAFFSLPVIKDIVNRIVEKDNQAKFGGVVFAGQSAQGSFPSKSTYGIGGIVSEKAEQHVPFVAVDQIAPQ